MRYFLAIGLVASLMVTACSQPETRARYHQYGGILSAGSSLGMHTMRKGETLWSVAKSYNVDLRDMLDMNKLSAPYKTRVGERIKIPAPSNYTVRRADTLYKVSRMFDTTTTELARLNNIKAPYKLAAGQKLRLPPRYAQPKPFVMQKSLQDFYVEYELYAYVDRPLERILIISQLHANIQDQFNTHGVQIMSPHFVLQPRNNVVVNRENWYAPPAEKP